MLDCVAMSARPSLPRRVGRRLRRAFGGRPASAPVAGPRRSADPIPTGVRERIPIRPTVARAGARINLVVPALDGAAVFGGIRTALDLFAAVVGDAPRARIVAVRNVEPVVADTFAGWRLATPDGDAAGDERTIVGLGRDAAGAVLAVGPDDVFLATYWTTAQLVAELRDWQRATYGAVPPHFGYLIQDFEPGFYARSAQYLLALATYGDPEATVAIFNTSVLRDAFHAEGLRFAEEFAFEPRLAPELGAAAASVPVARERRIVVYGRPSKPRNAFPLILDGLRAWVAATPDAAAWTVVSAGQAHPPLELGRGMTLASVGKLDMAGYAALLRSSAVGISLMVSPHPSYPPLEMAQLGMLVLTNRFGGKDLATWHTNIASLDDVRPAGFAAALASVTQRFTEDPTVGDRGRATGGSLTAEGPPFPFADELAARLRP